ncbi:hypothetical protein SKAU_G00029440 [Synaphobranchus kaupii]|uniref:Uncharacterized protein n=1 Tax=Synaphobranchus kaupii TaxID=118154 RepID=A0A9Q1JD04_SYNKA|nr:hypothetical protein SKAU_G00029440 [Synaphobranchus kaupii]
MAAKLTHAPQVSSPRQGPDYEPSGASMGPQTHLARWGHNPYTEIKLFPAPYITQMPQVDLTEQSNAGTGGREKFLTPAHVFEYTVGLTEDWATSWANHLLKRTAALPFTETARGAPLQVRVRPAAAVRQRGQTHCDFSGEEPFGTVKAMMATINRDARPLVLSLPSHPISPISTHPHPLLLIRPAHSANTSLPPAGLGNHISVPLIRRGRRLASYREGACSDTERGNTLPPPPPPPQRVTKARHRHSPAMPVKGDIAGACQKDKPEVPVPLSSASVRWHLATSPPPVPPSITTTASPAVPMTCKTKLHRLSEGTLFSSLRRKVAKDQLSGNALACRGFDLPLTPGCFRTNSSFHKATLTTSPPLTQSTQIPVISSH